MTETEQRVTQHLESLLSVWDEASDEDKREAVETALSRIPRHSVPAGAVVTFTPICPHFTNTQLERMNGRCPECGN